MIAAAVALLVILALSGLAAVMALATPDRKEEKTEVPAGFTKDMLAVHEYCKSAEVCDGCPFDVVYSDGKRQCRLHGVPVYWDVPTDRKQMWEGQT